MHVWIAAVHSNGIRAMGHFFLEESDPVGRWRERILLPRGNFLRLVRRYRAPWRIMIPGPHKHCRTIPSAPCRMPSPASSTRTANLVWCRFFFGGNGAGFLQNEGATDVSVDSQGNAYLAGNFVSNYPTTVGGSPLSLVPYGGAGTDAFLLKLDGADGSLIWEKQFGSPNDDNIYQRVSVPWMSWTACTSAPSFVNTAELNSAGTIGTSHGQRPPCGRMTVSWPPSMRLANTCGAAPTVVLAR
jgi:hypothetical protein